MHAARSPLLLSAVLLSTVLFPAATLHAAAQEPQLQDPPPPDRASEARPRLFRGNTPLHDAALRRDLAAVRRLLAAGAAVDARNADGATPLHLATGSAEVVRALLAAGAARRGGAAARARGGADRAATGRAPRRGVGRSGGGRPAGGRGRGRAGLRGSLATRAGVLAGGQSGEPAVVPGYAADSPLIRCVTGEVEDLEMPPPGKRGQYPALTDEQVGRLRAWIDGGAR